jgi:hypothetical protein
MAKSELLLESLTRFFEQPEHFEKLSDILTHRKGISLRNLEWFVTNYSKQQHVTYQTPNGRQFTVHVAYKSVLSHGAYRVQGVYDDVRPAQLSSVVSPEWNCRLYD